MLCETCQTRQLAAPPHGQANDRYVQEQERLAQQESDAFLKRQREGLARQRRYDEEVLRWQEEQEAAGRALMKWYGYQATACVDI